MVDKWAVGWIVGSAAFWAGLLFLGLSVRRPSSAGHRIFRVGDVVRDPDGALLWVLDPGTREEGGKLVRMASPRVFGFIRDTGEAAHQISLKGLSRAWSGEEKLQIESSKGGKTYIYVVECKGRVVVVWDVKEAKGMRAILPAGLSKCGPFLGSTICGVGNETSIVLLHKSGLVRVITAALRAKNPRPFEILHLSTTFNLAESASGFRLPLTGLHLIKTAAPLLVSSELRKIHHQLNRTATRVCLPNLIPFG